jgi:hypothetical protein
MFSSIAALIRLMRIRLDMGCGAVWRNALRLYYIPVFRISRAARRSYGAKVGDDKPAA